MSAVQPEFLGCAGSRFSAGMLDGASPRCVFGVIGTALSKNIGIFQSSSLKVDARCAVAPRGHLLTACGSPPCMRTGRGVPHAPGEIENGARRDDSTAPVSRRRRGRSRRSRPSRRRRRARSASPACLGRSGCCLHEGGAVIKRHHRKGHAVLDARPISLAVLARCGRASKPIFRAPGSRLHCTECSLRLLIVLKRYANAQVDHHPFLF
jgi:hypothetical protein